MNIFILDRDPKKIAEYHCDKHIVKMPLESAQILSTVHRIIDGIPCTVKMIYNDKTDKYKVLRKPKILRRMNFEIFVQNTFYPKIYQSSHENHPCTKWTMASIDNYLFHVEIFKELLNEFQKRRGKVHSSSKLLSYLSEPPSGLTIKGLTPFAQAMPQHLKSDDAIKSYRQYYIENKSDIAKWNWGTPAPYWW